MNKRTLLKLSAMVLALGLVTGCASTDKMMQMQADISKAQQTADAAMSDAKEALSAADEADRKASAAMNAANAAQSAADECSERCDRMMSKSMAK